MQEHDAMDGDTDGGDTRGNLDCDNIEILQYNWFDISSTRF